MSKLKKKKTILLIFALLTSICLIIGIPLIIYSAISNKWLLMGLGIFMVAVSFYSCPLLWVLFARTKYNYSLAEKIEKDNVYSIDTLAGLFGSNIASTMSDVKNLISKRYISNYLVDENSRMIINNDTKKLITFHCPSCGSSILKNDTNKYVCEYCHTSFEYK